MYGVTELGYLGKDIGDNETEKDRLNLPLHEKSQ